MNSSIKIASALLALLLAGLISPMAAEAAIGERALFPHNSEQRELSGTEDALRGPSSPEESTSAGSPEGEEAEEPPGRPLPDGSLACGSAAELLRLVNEAGAKRITLTADLDWTFSSQPDEPASVLTPAGPTVVAMNGHTLRVAAEGWLDIQGPLRFEGDGAGRPLLTVEGRFSGEEVKISARGEGAAALCLKAGGFWDSDWMELSAEGAGATALLLEGEQTVDLYCFSAAARGKGAVGIRSEGPLRLYCCSVVSDGEAIVCRDLLLDGCGVRPAPEGARVIRRHAVPSDRIEQIGYSALAGTPWESIQGWFAQKEDGSRFVQYELYDLENAANTWSLSIRVMQAGIPVDCSAAGTHILSAQPVSLPAWFPIEIPAFTAPFHVVSPGIPWIDTAWLTGADGLQFVFLAPIKDADRIDLEYSLDKGKTWNDARGLPRCEIYGDSAYLAGLTPDHTYYFRLTVTGGPMAGVSNILEFPYTSGDPTQIGGGDRDDGDRGEQDGLPDSPVIPPPPDETITVEKNDVPNDVPSDESIAAGKNDVPPADPQRPAGEAGSSSSLPVGGSAPLPSESVPETASQPERAAPSSAPAEQPAGAAAAQRPPEANFFLTAAELAAQRQANPEGITLIGEGIRAALPDALLALLPAGEPLSLQLERDDAGNFLLRLWAGTQEVTNFGDHPVRVTLRHPNGVETAFCRTGPDGAVVSAAENKNGRLRFELKAAGAYQLSESPPPAQSGPPASSAASESLMQPTAAPSAAPPSSGPGLRAPVWTAAILLAAGLALSGAVLFLRQKKGGRP